MERVAWHAERYGAGREVSDDSFVDYLSNSCDAPLKKDSGIHRLKNATEASGYYFRFKANAKIRSWEGFAKPTFLWIQDWSLKPFAALLLPRIVLYY